MSIDLSALRTYILANHAEDAAARKDGTIAAALNAESGTRTVSAFINERTILAAFANPVDGETVLQTLEAVAESQSPMAPLLARVVRWMRPSEQGIDIGHASTRAMIDALVTAEVLNETQANTIKALGEVPGSIAYTQFGAPVTVAQVSAALNQG